jgi:ADP-heptose:LPS heptosyltransferase
MISPHGVHTGQLPAYPTPHPPMVGQYLVRKKYVAAGLTAIDAACSVMATMDTRPALDKSGNFRSILISQGGHLGDLIMTLPALHWIRQHRPNMKIGLIVGSWARPMIEGIAELYDHCYFADHFMLDRSSRPLKQKIIRHRASWKAAAAQIRQDGYEVAMECYPFLQNNIPLLHASGIPIRIGFTSGGFGPLLTHRFRWVHASRPFLDYPRDLLRQLFGDQSLNQELRAYYPAAPSTEKVPPTPYVVMQTGTGNAIREWPEDRWIQLAKDLTARGVSVVLAGAGARERERADRISQRVPAVVNLCDRLSWDEFAALIARAAHVICLESSASHLAAAFQIHSTVIMPATNDPRQFGPANDNARILTYPTPCAPCFRSLGCDHMTCIQGVSAADATHAVLGDLGIQGLTDVSDGR